LIYIFIHQNFPAQYGHLARHFANAPGNRVYFITQPSQSDIPGVVKLTYRPRMPASTICHPYTVDFDAAVRTGTAVLNILRHLDDAGVRPDIVIGHCGWGETLFVKDIFPDVPVLSYFEYFYHARGADVGFDPEFSPSLPDDDSRLRIQNALSRLTFCASDFGHTATRWQRSLFPADMQGRIVALHEGIDTGYVAPDPKAWLRLTRDELILTRGDEVITFAARNLEPYRGFHVLMRALPGILARRPNAHVLIVGGDDVSYGAPPRGGGTYRDLLLTEIGAESDAARVHFLGQLSFDDYLNVLQVSSAHIYLSYPFIVSWSLIEAMASGCLVIGSSTPGVREILRDRENGLIVDFFSADQICDRVDEVFADPDRMQRLRDAARATAVREFDLRSRTLPLWFELIDAVIAGRQPIDLPPEPGLATEMRLR
jgi:glycosyltransferase involved in cell wall biosynthesis